MTICYGPIIALKKINLEIAKKEIIALLGSNGAGKSTLLKSIMGLEKPIEGSIIYQEKYINLWKSEKISRFGIHLIPEDGGIFKTLTVEENLKLGAYHFFHQYQNQLEKVVHLFPILKTRLKQISGTLSGGEQRILSFGKALMSNSQILMLDEPSLGLSPKFSRKVFKIIQELNQLGYTILLAEQNVKQALEYAHRVYILEGGKIVLHGNADYVKDHSRIKEAYLGN